MLLPKKPRKVNKALGFVSLAVGLIVVGVTLLELLVAEKVEKKLAALLMKLVNDELLLALVVLVVAVVEDVDVDAGVNKELCGRLELVGVLLLLALELKTSIRAASRQIISTAPDPASLFRPCGHLQGCYCRTR